MQLQRLFRWLKFSWRTLSSNSENTLLPVTTVDFKRQLEKNSDSTKLWLKSPNQYTMNSFKVLLGPDFTTSELKRIYKTYVKIGSEYRVQMYENYARYFKEEECQEKEAFFVYCPAAVNSLTPFLNYLAVEFDEDKYLVHASTYQTHIISKNFLIKSPQKQELETLCKSLS